MLIGDRNREIVEESFGRSWDLEGTLLELGEELEGLEEKTIQTLSEAARALELSRMIGDIRTTLLEERLLRNIFDDSLDDPTPTPVPFQLAEEEVEGNNFATARTLLSKSAWSKNFVHGSDMLTPVSQLAEKVLKPGERLTQLDTMRWHRPVRCDMRLEIYDQERPLGDVDVSGCFLTSENRMLYFSGTAFANNQSLSLFDGCHHGGAAQLHY